MPDAAWAVSVHPPSSSRKMGQPPVLTSSNPLSTLLQRFACARLSQSCLSKSCSDFFPQRSPPSLLTTAACGGLRSTPDCRPRRTYLHLSYSYAAPCGPALLVTQGHFRTHAVQQKPPGGTLMLKRVVAIFDATQKVRKSPGTLAGDGNLGHLEGMTAWGHGLAYR